MRLFNPRAKGNRWDEKALKQRSKIEERAFGRFCGKTKYWIIPFGINPKQYEDGKAYGKQKGSLAQTNHSFVYLTPQQLQRENDIMKTKFKSLAGELNWSTKKWYIPEGAKIETFMDCYPIFADKTKILASFKGVAIVMNATTCSISGDGRDAKKQRTE